MLIFLVIFLEPTTESLTAICYKKYCYVLRKRRANCTALDLYSIIVTFLCKSLVKNGVVAGVVA